MPRRPQPLPEALAGRPFDRTALEDAQRPIARSRRKDLHRPYHGVYAEHVPTTLRERCDAYAVRMRDGQVFSHATAALLHGLPLPATAERAGVLHVAVVRPASPPRTAGVVGHRLPVPPAWQTLDGLPVCAPSEAWAQLGGELALDDLIAIADRLLTDSPFDDAGTRRLLLRRVDAFRRPHAALLRAALEEAGGPVASADETRTRLLLVRAGLPEPESGAGLAVGHGQRPLALAWPRQRVGLDLVPHGSDPGARPDDGWSVLHATAADLRDPRRGARLVDRVRRRLDERG